jgi:hypothetical protein
MIRRGEEPDALRCPSNAVLRNSVGFQGITEGKADPLLAQLVVRNRAVAGLGQKLEQTPIRLRNAEELLPVSHIFTSTNIVFSGSMITHPDHVWFDAVDDPYDSLIEPDVSRLAMYRQDSGEFTYSRGLTARTR